jgi:hypothetical protein
MKLRMIAVAMLVALVGMLVAPPQTSADPKQSGPDPRFRHAGRLRCGGAARRAAAIDGAAPRAGRAWCGRAVSRKRCAGPYHGD